MFIGYAQNSATYRFVSVNDYSISEYRDVEFFEHVFPLEKKLTDVASVNLPASSSNDRVLVTEPRRGKRRRVETNIKPDFVTPFIVESIITWMLMS